MEFSKILHESMANGIRNVLGEEVMQTILFYLQLGEQTSSPREFDSSLRSIFKDGALTLEKIIVKELYERLNLPYREEDSFDFERHVAQAREVTKGGLEKELI